MTYTHNVSYRVFQQKFSNIELGDICIHVALEKSSFLKIALIQYHTIDYRWYFIHEIVLTQVAVEGDALEAFLILVALLGWRYLSYKFP